MCDGGWGVTTVLRVSGRPPWVEPAPRGPILTGRISGWRVDRWAIHDLRRSEVPARMVRETVGAWTRVRRV
jgi:hypothetical protein